MKRAKRKETTRTNQQCLTKNEDENNWSSIIPLDLIIEILLKIPTKSIARFVLVSKQWSSIIRGKEFTKLYIARSSTRMRLLFTVQMLAEQFLQSCSQNDPSSNCHSLNITPYTHIYAYSPPIRGLICRKIDSRVMIANPSTGQLLTLPRVKTIRRDVLSFFGYDPVNDVYKVLCMTVLQLHLRRGSRVVSEEHQVYTLGVGQQKWRRVECKHPHLPPSRPNLATKGLCINGTLYYYAWIKSEGVLISFHLISEKFNVIKLPENNRCIVNYNGKLAIAGRITIDGALDLWVLEDASKQEWSKVSLLVPCWRDLAGTNIGFRSRGTLSTGELMFSTPSCVNYYFVSYNPKENNAKRVLVEGIGDLFNYLELYFDHVESPMFLSL